MLDQACILYIRDFIFSLSLITFHLESATAGHSLLFINSETEDMRVRFLSFSYSLSTKTIDDIPLIELVIFCRHAGMLKKPAVFKSSRAVLYLLCEYWITNIFSQLVLFFGYFSITSEMVCFRHSCLFCGKDTKKRWDRKTTQ